jgi:hypothetical protein
MEQSGSKNASSPSERVDRKAAWEAVGFGFGPAPARVVPRKHQATMQVFCPLWTFSMMAESWGGKVRFSLCFHTLEKVNSLFVFQQVVIESLCQKF